MLNFFKIIRLQFEGAKLQIFSERDRKFIFFLLLVKKHENIL